VSDALIEVAAAAMGTVVSIQLAQVEDATGATTAAREALDLLPLIEQCCSRFREDSELWALCQRSPGLVEGSPLLVELLALAVVLAERTDGAYDPTVGASLHARGFRTAWDSGRCLELPTGCLPGSESAARGGWRQLRVDRGARTIDMRAPLLLDLGGLAKGFAVDLLRHHLSAFPNVCINAGGDVRASGTGGMGIPWRIGIRDPLTPNRLVAQVALDEGAVCTTAVGGRSGTGGGRHVVVPHRHAAECHLASVSVLASTAVVADGLSTAAFVLGPEAAHPILCEEGASALFVLADGQLETVGVGAMAARWERC